MPGKFKYVDPNLLANPMPGEARPLTYTDPIQKAMGVVGPDKPMPPINTIDDVYSTVNQVQSFKNLIKSIPIQKGLYGQEDSEILEDMTREQPGFASRAFETVTKPFRWETSVTTAPIVAAMEAMRLSEFGDWTKTFKSIYPQMQKEALTGDREISVYDALRRYGMSNWGAVPLGIGADILLSPSTYTGIGGMTKLGRLAKAAKLAGEAGEVIPAASRVGGQMAKLTEKMGAKEAGEALKLAPTLAGQADLGQRALVKFMGKPIVKGEPVFKALGETGEALRNIPELNKFLRTFSTRLAPPGVDPQQWQKLMNLKRVRQTQIGLKSKDFLQKELKPLVEQAGLSPEEVEEVWAVMQRQYGGGVDLPWDKLNVTDVPDSTLLSAMGAKYPGLIPNVQILDPKDFKAMAKQHKVPVKGDSFTVGGVGDETITYVKKDKELSKASMDSFTNSIQGVQEGRQVFAALPTKIIDDVKKVYGHSGPTTPELVEKFGADWEKFISGNDFALPKEFKKLATKVSEKPGLHTLVEGVKDVAMPDGSVRRIVGDMKFINQEQEAVRSFMKSKFDELIQSEQSLGILNRRVEDYIPGIYTFKGTKFKGGKEFSTKPWFTKEKAFRTPIEAEAAGYDPIKNIFELAGIRAHTSFKAQESAKLLDEAADLFGIPVQDPLKMSNTDWAKLGKAGINPENRSQLTAYLRKEGYAPVTIGKGKEVWFQQEIADSLQKVMKPLSSEESINSFWRMYDGALNVWKGAVTSINPKFHMRNMISNNFLLYLKDGAQGLNPIRHKMAYDVLSGKNGQILTDTGKVITYDEIRKMIEETGLKGSGFMSGEMSAAFRSELRSTIGTASKLQKVNPLSPKSFPMEAGRKFGTAVENEAKVVGFINDLMQHGDPMEAAKNTFKYLYDYMDLTAFERHAAKRLIPFYTWMSKNIPNMMQSMVTQPGKMGAVTSKIPMVFEHKVKAQLRERGEEFPSEVQPKFVREQGMFPVNFDEEGKIAHYLPGLPYSDLSRLGVKELASGLTPALKGLIEQIPRGGYSIFMDRPVEQYEGQMVEAPAGTGLLPQALKDMLGVRTEETGEYMPAETAALIGTLIPPIRTPGKLAEAWRVPEKAKYILPSELLGQKAVPIDPKMERRATLQEWLTNIQAGRKVERGLERKEGRRLVEEKKGLTLEDIMRLREMHYGKGKRR